MIYTGEPESNQIFFSVKKKIYFYREGKGGRKRGRNIDMWETLIMDLGCPSHAPNRGPGPQPRHVPWLGIKPATFWFTGRHSIHWATPARALMKSLKLTSVWRKYERWMNNQLTLQRNKQTNPKFWIFYRTIHLVSSHINYLRKGKNTGEKGETILAWETLDN